MPIIIPSSGDAAEILVGNRIKLPNGNLIVPPTNYLSKFFDATQSLGTISTGTVSQTGNRTAPNASWAQVSAVQFTIIQAPSSALRGTTNYILDGGSTSVTGSVLLETPVFTVDGVDLGKPISVSFDSVLNDFDGAYDVCIVRYNSSGVYQETIPISGNASLATVPSAKIPTGTGTFRGFFIAHTTASDLYSLRFRRLAGSNSLRIDSLYVGPQSQLSSAAVTDPVAFTPTWTSTGTAPSLGNGVLVGNYWRDGKVANVQIGVQFGTTTTAGTGAFTFGVAGIGTLDTAVSGTTPLPFYGTANATDSGVGYHGGNVRYFSPTTLQVVDDDGGLEWGGGSSIPFAWSNGDEIWMTFQVPIANWSSNVTTADRAVEEYAYNTSTADSDDTTSFGYGASGVQFGNFTAPRIKRVRFQTPIQATDSIVLEILRLGIWQPIAAFGSGNALVEQYQMQGTASYGMTTVSVSASNPTDVDVQFGTYRLISTGAYGAAGIGWSGAVGAGVGWRVRKVSGGAAVGYPVGARNVVGDVTGTAISAGYLGENQIVQNTAGTTLSTGGATIQSITLAAGIWLLDATVSVTGATSGDGLAGYWSGLGALQPDIARAQVGSLGYFSLPIRPRIVQPTTSTSYSVVAENSVANRGTGYATIRAVRIA